MPIGVTEEIRNREYRVGLTPASVAELKVREPQPGEVAMLGPRHLLFTYLHLAADKPQAQGLMKSGATCIAYETATANDRSRPS